MFKLSWVYLATSVFASMHKNIDAEPEAFLRIIKKYRENIVVAVECIFTTSEHNRVRS